ncbi:FG-GAP repeat protein [Arenibacterium halophilum]|uniref:FG-GAP repeat-containing protein n=1 Tax=Arenibacterium halophilum TaxID=2583821 RepID=A0ABY2X9G0_9RHOB|nr:FG-GAP repeat protein [Arenibacterium halophilum]TMV12683.1 hypothetical protein FGK64_07700 [Arenibacterium halophilum]
MNILDPLFTLAALDGTNGFRMLGEAAAANFGETITYAGDLNGDGFADVVVGAFGRELGATVNVGAAYVIYGTDAGFPTNLDVTTLNGTNGFRIDGAAAYDIAGRGLSHAGDVNGDGLDDLIVGAPGADGRNGAAYVIFGDTGGFSATFSLSALDGTNGFKLGGAATDETAGRAVSSAGDVNGDGIDDLIIGAPAHNNGRGETYVVFGTTTGFAAEVDLSTLDGSNGFRIIGRTTDGDMGRSVSSAGDINGDGVDDILIGAFRARTNTGDSYVVFGRATDDFSATINLNGLDGTDGFRLRGTNSNDFSGFSVNNVGDINNDGFDDLAVGAFLADPHSGQSGSTYVVFGGTSGFPSDLSLSSLDGTNGFRLDGEVLDEQSGRSVSSAGDVNGDGIDDLLIGATGVNASAGRAYVVYGHDGPFARQFDLSSLTEDTGFVIDGTLAGGEFGFSVSALGDVNGDGYDDIGVGAPTAAENGNKSGAAYVLFGGPAPINGTAGADTLTGTSRNDILRGFGGNDTLNGGHGDDEIDGGAGKDTAVFSGPGAVNVDLRIAGPQATGRGTDTLIRIENLTSGGGDDSLLGKGGRNTLKGNDGNDTLRGFAGHDRLYGGKNNDTLYGDNGNDRVWGGNGRDTAFLGNGNDVYVDTNQSGKAGADTVHGGAGDDTINGGGGNDTLNGDAGTDEIRGGTGNDQIDGGADDDTLYGDAGNDRILGGNGRDTVYMGDGADTFVDAKQKGNAGSDSVYGGKGNDIFNGRGGHDTFHGEAGNDTLRGGANNDTLNGGVGDDILNGGAGRDTAEFTGQSDISVDLRITGPQDTGQGMDTLISIEHVTSGAGSDLLHGDGGNNRLNSGNGADDLYGHNGNDTLIGGGGADTLFGGSGDDTLRGGAGADTFVMQGNWGHDTIVDFEDGVDIIDVYDTGVQSTGAFIRTMNGNDAVLAFGGNSITILNTTLAELTNADFNFAPEEPGTHG